MLIAVIGLVLILAITGRLGLNVGDLLEPEYESEERDLISGPDDSIVDFHEALRSYSSARRGE